MQAPRILSVVFLILALCTGSAFAECAWVLPNC